MTLTLIAPRFDLDPSLCCIVIVTVWNRMLLITTLNWIVKYINHYIMWKLSLCSSGYLYTGIGYLDKQSCTKSACQKNCTRRYFGFNRVTLILVALLPCSIFQFIVISLVLLPCSIFQFIVISLVLLPCSVF